jgi:hypothetical protein
LTLGSDLPPVPLSGSGALQTPGAACTVSSASLDFGVVAVGNSKLALFKVYSTGTAPVILDVVASCGAFSVPGGGGPRTLAPGDSLAVTVGFAPGAGGHIACTVATGPGCPDVAVTGDATSVSFATQVLPLFTLRTCNTCHQWRRASDFVNVRSVLGYAPAVLVKPFDPANSVLYGKVSGTKYLPSMPLGGALIPTSEQNLIQTWILEGAHDN